MKHTQVFAFAVLAAMLSATIFGCKPNVESGNSTVTVTVTGDERTVMHEPNTFQVNSGTPWQDIKGCIHITYADGFEENGWKLDGKDGTMLTGDYRFTEDTTVFAVSRSKENQIVVITVDADEGYELHTEHTLTVKKDSHWKDIKYRQRVW